LAVGGQGKGGAPATLTLDLGRRWVLIDPTSCQRRRDEYWILSGNCACVETKIRSTLQKEEGAICIVFSWSSTSKCSEGRWHSHGCAFLLPPYKVPVQYVAGSFLATRPHGHTGQGCCGSHNFLARPNPASLGSSSTHLPPPPAEPHSSPPTPRFNHQLNNHPEPGAVVLILLSSPSCPRQ
jgi:hypothetical protein